MKDVSAELRSIRSALDSARDHASEDDTRRAVYALADAVQELAELVERLNQSARSR